MNKAKYDWQKIFADQKQSGKTIKGYCQQNNICLSNFYKQKRAQENRSTFSEIDIIKEQPHAKYKELIKLKINETTIEIPISALDVVIKGIL